MTAGLKIGAGELSENIVYGMPGQHCIRVFKNFTFAGSRKSYSAYYYAAVDGLLLGRPSCGYGATPDAAVQNLWLRLSVATPFKQHGEIFELPKGWDK